MSIELSATTPVPELLHGMTRLKVPRLLVAIIAFMLRYIDVLVEQLGRMRRRCWREVTPEMAVAS